MATALLVMILKYQTLSGAARTAIRYTPLPASTVRTIIIPDVFAAGRETLCEGSHARGSYRFLTGFHYKEWNQMDNNIIDITSCNVLPMPPVLKTANGQEIKYIRRDEVQRIMSVIEGRDRLMVEALWNTGARISEVL